MLRRIGFLFAIFAFAITPSVSEAARLPSAKTAQSVTQKFLDQYGKKYPETVFGFHNLERVEIHSIREISYHVVYADTALIFKSGKTGRALVRLKNAMPRGWRVVSWELAQD